MILIKWDKLKYLKSKNNENKKNLTVYLEFQFKNKIIKNLKIRN